MGRKLKYYVGKVWTDRDGYDSAGRYWGVTDPARGIHQLYRVVVEETGAEHIFRASSPESAKAFAKSYRDAQADKQAARAA